MASRKSIWFQLGHALERARVGAPATGKKVGGLAERRTEALADRSRNPDAAARPSLPSTDDLMAAGIAIVVERVLGSWGKRRQPGFSGLLRAGAAGAAAALLVDLVRPLLHGNADLPGLDRATADRILTGIGHGLVYGAVIEPRIPGPALVKGALYGSAEYATDTIGGLSGLLGTQTPQGRLPMVSEALDGLDRHDRDYLEHVAFGIAVALIYESSSSSNGIRPDAE